MKKTPFTKRCPRCRGTGESLHYYDGSNYYDVCETCAGTGEDPYCTKCEGNGCTNCKGTGIK